MRSFANDSSVRKGLVLPMLVGLLVMPGCSGESSVVEEEEVVGSVEQAFGSSSCGTTGNNASFTGTINLSSGHTSPSTYNNCFRGYVVDINSLSFPYNWDLRARWAGSQITTQAACEQSWGAAIFYKKVNGTWVDQTGVLESYGQWFPASGPFAAYCLMPDVHYPGTAQSGADWRIAATMRTQYGGATLRPIFFQTQREPT